MKSYCKYERIQLILNSLNFWIKLGSKYTCLALVCPHVHNAQVILFLPEIPSLFFSLPKSKTHKETIMRREGIWENISFQLSKVIVMHTIWSEMKLYAETSWWGNISSMSENGPVKCLIIELI